MPIISNDIRKLFDDLATIVASSWSQGVDVESTILTFQTDAFSGRF